MVAVPMKPEYGPTLGRLLAPRWRAASTRARTGFLAATLASVALLAGLTLTLLDASYSHGGNVPFSFSYRGLYRVAPDPGGYVKVDARAGDGTLRYSFAVEPLTLPPYSRELNAVYPLFASAYVEQRMRVDSSFQLRGEGRAKVNGVPAYDIGYLTAVEGRRMYGRDILLLPQRRGARDGVVITLLAGIGLSKQVKGPLEVGTTGPLLRPLRSFSIG